MVYSTKMWKILLTLLAIVGSTLGQNGTQITISLFATDLTGCDATSACDAVVKILCASISSDWSQCGITSEMKDDNFPVWPELFKFNYIPSQNMRWRFDLVDMDLLENDPIGSITLAVEDFIAATGTQPTKKFDIAGRGSFFIHKRT